MCTARYVFKVIAVLFFGVFASSLLAKEPAKASLSFSDLTKPPAQEIAAGPCQSYSGDSRAICEQNVKAEFEHRRWRMEYTQKAFEAHHIYTVFVFVLVCALVVLGMWLSFAEFRRASRPPTASSRRKPNAGKASGASGTEGAASADPAVDARANADATNTHLELGSSGVKLTSPVLGVVVLIVSMGFFYLYLKTVYPIEEAQTAGANSSIIAEAQKSAQTQK